MSARGARARHVAWGGLVLLAATGCVDHPAAAPAATRAHVALAVRVGAEGEQVDVEVAYARDASADVALARQSFDVAAAGARELRLAVDLGRCLADPQRAATSVARACPLMVTLVLRDAAGTMLDSTRLGPLEAFPGRAVEPPVATLQAAAALTLVGGGGQAGWSGAPLPAPVRVRLTDRAGQPIAHRTLAVTALAGGGAPDASAGLVRTDAAGEAAIRYVLGDPVGTQRFRISPMPGGSAATLTVTATAVPSGVRDLAAGAYFTCATRGAIPHCWGSNGLGALGIAPSAADTATPVPVSGTVTATALAATGDNSTLAQAACLLDTAGEARCWGVNEFAELGVGATPPCTTSSSGATSDCARAPLPVGGGRRFRSITVGGGAPRARAVRACALTDGGEAYCWGDNDAGALGDGTTTRRTVPTRVATATRWLQLDAGESSTCGIDAALTVHCWGADDAGQLGRGGRGNAAPIPVSPALPASVRFVQVEVGSRWACALAEGGAVYCWGTDWATGAIGVLPREVSRGVSFTQISVGATLMCGIAADGGVYCLGRGQPGNGLADQAAAAPQRALLAVPATSISVGLAHACARATGGDLYCWGRGTGGALGVSGETDFLFPVRVVFDPTSAGAPAELAPMTALDLGRATRGATVRVATPAVRVVDANGVGVASVAVDWRPSAGGTVAAGARSVTGTDGVASAGEWRISTTAGTNTVHATVPAIPGAQSVTFTVQGVISGAPMQLVGSACFGSGGCAIPVATDAAAAVGGIGVTALDADGLVVPGAQVAIARNATGSAISPALPAVVTTDADGAATITTWRLDSLARADTVSFSLLGVAGSLQRAIVTGTPLAAARVQLVQRPSAQALAGVVLGPWPVVEVADRYGNRVRDAAPILLTATVDSGPAGATLTGATTATAVGGQAAFSSLTLPAGGEHRISIGAPGLVPATFVLFASSLRTLPTSIVTYVDVTPVTLTALLVVPAGTGTAVTFTPADSSVIGVFTSVPGGASASVVGGAEGSTTIRVASVWEPRLWVDVPVSVIPMPSGNRVAPPEGATTGGGAAGRRGARPREADRLALGAHR